MRIFTEDTQAVLKVEQQRRRCVISIFRTFQLFQLKRSDVVLYARPTDQLLLLAMLTSYISHSRQAVLCMTSLDVFLNKFYRAKLKLQQAHRTVLAQTTTARRHIINRTLGTALGSSFTKESNK